jgi:hypothetical protein
MNNKIICSFILLNEYKYFIKNIEKLYTFTKHNIFLFEGKNNNETKYFLTYNIEVNNINYLPSNTILLHRNKTHNVLYSINSLNILIKKLNNGILNKTYSIPWDNYKNTLLLCDNNNIKQLNTKIIDIIKI